ncbi:hypothetical protein BY458DRAFT_514065 [Sporodiniella umbellata]|nr:hypothetical protein BY458DRAFT_514065 [Sporodiniella umbellata]
MSNIQRLCLLNGSKRWMSSQYIPGRKGYAPGFEAPKGTRETPKIQRKRRDIAQSIPSHLGSTRADSQSANSAQQLYRRELKLTRHRYAQELLEIQGRKDTLSAEKLAASEQKMANLNQYFDQVKKEKKKHEEEVADLLGLKPEGQVAEDRTQLRNQQRLAFDQVSRDIRRKQLLKIYSQTSDFVTLENLDAKVDFVVQSRRHPQGLDELMNSSNDLLKEIEQRKSQIKEVMGV